MERKFKIAARDDVEIGREIRPSIHKGLLRGRDVNPITNVKDWFIT